MRALPGVISSTKEKIFKNYYSMHELSEYILEQYDQYAKNKEYLKTRGSSEG